MHKQGIQATEVSEAQAADTATFYSISSTQKGLAGVDLGNFLIKQVAHKVLAEFPGVQSLVTLSPIPGFRAWLDTQVQAELNRNETVCSLAIVSACHVGLRTSIVQMQSLSTKRCGA